MSIKTPKSFAIVRPKQQRASHRSAPRGSVRSMSDVLRLLADFSDGGQVRRMIGYAVRWETSDGQDRQITWGKLQAPNSGVKVANGGLAE